MHVFDACTDLTAIERFVAFHLPANDRLFGAAPVSNAEGPLMAQSRSAYANSISRLIKNE
jgi:hypothetical protein